MRAGSHEPLDTPPPALPPRPRDGHKGTFGTVLVIGGTAGAPTMLGGPCLAGQGSLRAGCGLVVLAVPKALLAAALTVLPEATAVDMMDLDSALKKVRPQAIAVGPGLGQAPETDQIVARLCEDSTTPRVFDADALGSIARQEIDGIRGPAVLTPHPGEWLALAKSLKIDGDPISADARPAAALALASRLDKGGGPVVVVLKGAETIVSDGEHSWRCGVREPVLAVGGSGDVLTGVVASLIAQFHPRAGEAVRGDRLDLFGIACAATALHGRAGERIAARMGDSGMLARELADEIPLARAEETAS